MMLRKGKIVLPDPLLGVKNVFERLLLESETEIVQRTQSGKKIDGGNFKKYSKGYAAYKVSKGRKASPVDLTFTGAMLRGVHSKITKLTKDFIEGRIFISPDQQDKANWNQERRPFFGLSKKQIDYINKKIGDAIHGGK